MNLRAAADRRNEFQTYKHIIMMIKLTLKNV